MVDIQKQAADALEGVLDGYWLPDEPNATRVRYEGGTENAAGELEGRTRLEHRFRLSYQGKRSTTETTRAGDKTADNLDTAMLLEEVLEVGDLLELDGDPSTYKVEVVEPARSSRVFAYTVQLQEVEAGG